MIECSFEGRDEDTIKEVFQNHKNEFLLEIRKEDEEFEVYKPGSKFPIVTFTDPRHGDYFSGWYFRPFSITAVS